VGLEGDAVMTAISPTGAPALLCSIE